MLRTRSSKVEKLDSQYHYRMRPLLLILGLLVLGLSGWMEFFVLAEVLFGIETSGGSGTQWRLTWADAIIPSIITAIGIALIILGIKLKGKIKHMRENGQGSLEHFH